MLCTFATLAALSASPARAGVLWYNGDYDNRDALSNGTTQVDRNGLLNETSKVYDNFVVPTGQVWTITSVFSNDQINYQGTGNAVTKATWAILKGVSSGNGGTVVASGDTAATQTPLSQTSGYYYPYSPYQISATVSSVTLTAGTYWLSVTPDNPSPEQNDGSYIMTTSGLNSVGQPMGNDGNSYISNTLTGAGALFFTPTSSNSVEGAGTWDYSMGVSGSFVATVPEPSSLVLVALGCLAVPALSRLRRN